MDRKKSTLSPAILGLAGLVLVLLIYLGMKQMKEHRGSRPEKEPKQKKEEPDNKVQKGLIEKISTAVGGRGAGGSSAGSSTDTPDKASGKTPGYEQKNAGNQNSIPLGFEAADEFTLDNAGIEKETGPEPSADIGTVQAPMPEEKSRSSGPEAIPLGYTEEEKKKEKKDNAKEPENK